MNDHKCVKCEAVVNQCSDITDEDKCYSCNHSCAWIGRSCVESHCEVVEEDEDEFECVRCKEGYALNGKVCEQSVDGCLRRSQGDVSVCVKCADGYFITNDFKCVACDSKCKTCVDGPNNCHSCYGDSDGRSKVTCEKCYDMNCLECDENPSVCTKCSGNYTLSANGKCEYGCFKEDIDGDCTMCSDRENNMNIVYPPTDDGVCMKYSKMPNTPAADSSFGVIVVLAICVVFSLI